MCLRVPRVSARAVCVSVLCHVSECAVCLLVPRVSARVVCVSVLYHVSACAVCLRVPHLSACGACVSVLCHVSACAVCVFVCCMCQRVLHVSACAVYVLRQRVLYNLSVWCIMYQRMLYNALACTVQCVSVCCVMCQRDVCIVWRWWLTTPLSPEATDRDISIILCACRICVYTYWCKSTVLGCGTVQLVDRNLLHHYSTLKMEVVVSFETFVHVFHTIQRHISKDNNLHNNCRYLSRLNYCLFNDAVGCWTQDIMAVLPDQGQAINVECINGDFEILRRIPNISQNIYGIFVRRLAVLEECPSAANCCFVLFWSVRT